MKSKLTFTKSVQTLQKFEKSGEINEGNECLNNLQNYEKLVATVHNVQSRLVHKGIWRILPKTSFWYGGIGALQTNELRGLPRQPFILKNVAAQRARNQAKQASRQPPVRQSVSTMTIGGGATLAPGQVYVRTFVFQKLGVPRMINWTITWYK